MEFILVGVAVFFNIAFIKWKFDRRAIGAVTEANLQKLTMPKDEHGKLTKPADFVGPEIKLQAILDERL